MLRQRRAEEIRDAAGRAIEAALRAGAASAWSNFHMRKLEYWVLRLADWDAAWIGFGWLRPAKRQRIGFGYILFCSVLLSLPGLAVGAGLIYWFVGRIEPRVWMALLALVTLVELPLLLLFGYYWNRRAASLTETEPAPKSAPR